MIAEQLIDKIQMVSDFIDELHFDGDGITC